MIIISLDEYGRFEEDSNRPLFIAGLTYDCGDNETEERTERSRIRAYYKRVISDAGEGYVYPEDLHEGRGQSVTPKDLKPLNQLIRNTLPEFIQNGTYQSVSLKNDNGKNIPGRKGEYALFVMLKSDDGKTSLLSENAGFLVKDDFAANRYFHMAESVLNRVVFHNPLQSIERRIKVKIDVASRASGNYDHKDDKSKISQFDQQGYRSETVNEAGKQYYKIMDTDVYRTLVAQELLRGGSRRAEVIYCKARSISYKGSGRDMEFLYMADTLCSYIRDGLNHHKNADYWLKQTVKMINDDLNPKVSNLVFGYDEIDNAFSEAWKKYEEKEYFDALCLTFDAKKRNGEFSKYYAKNWFPYLEKRIRESMRPQDFSICMDRLVAYTRTNNLEQEKLFYLVREFETIASVVTGKYPNVDAMNVDLYKLYDSAMSAYNHTGKAKKVREYYNKLKKYAAYAGLDHFFRSQNKLLVSMEDCFEWDFALKIAKENAEHLQMATEIKRDILKIKDDGTFLEEARAVSQLGRIYALERMPEADEKFREAMNMMERNSANYKITQSYLLHFYADMGMKEAYESEVTDYFDGITSYKQRIKHLIDVYGKKDEVISANYAFYVLMRGLYKFNLDGIDDALWTRLCGLRDAIRKKTGKEPEGHPWEIIYKYLELIAISRGDDKRKEEFASLKGNCLSEKGEMIIALDKFGCAEAADLEGNVVLRDQATNELADYLKANFDAFAKTSFSNLGNERYRELEKYFTFMYR